MPGPTIIFDLETRKLADEVGGWDHIARMGLACAVTLNMTAGEFHRYVEADAEALVAELQSAGLVVGFNIKRFDYTVLQPYTGVRLADLPTLDLLEHIHRALGFRLPLD
ncbi:MAG: helicase, partial [Chloroflexi bacterium]|nr:helicase [Chloroflexota bacterium]